MRAGKTASKLLSDDRFEVFQEIERVEDLLNFGMPSYKGSTEIAEEYREAAKEYRNKLRGRFREITGRDTLSDEERYRYRGEKGMKTRTEDTRPRPRRRASIVRTAGIQQYEKPTITEADLAPLGLDPSVADEILRLIDISEGDFPDQQRIARNIRNLHAVDDLLRRFEAAAPEEQESVRQEFADFASSGGRRPTPHRDTGFLSLEDFESGLGSIRQVEQSVRARLRRIAMRSKRSIKVAKFMDPITAFPNIAPTVCCENPGCPTIGRVQMLGTFDMNTPYVDTGVSDGVTSGVIQRCGWCGGSLKKASAEQSWVSRNCKFIKTADHVSTAPVPGPVLRGEILAGQTYATVRDSMEGDFYGGDTRGAARDHATALWKREGIGQHDTWKYNIDVWDHNAKRHEDRKRFLVEVDTTPKVEVYGNYPY